MTATVIIPTTGSSDLEQALNSVLNQTYTTKAYVVVDGIENYDKVDKILYHMKLPDMSRFNICVLPENVGANGFYGHRIYAAFTHLINTDYVLYLDQDCWMEPNHVETCIKTIEENNLDWCYSLRNIYEQNGEFACQDNCESLGPEWPIMGYPHVDTNCYCIKTSVATKVSGIWHGGWGQDRAFLNVLHNAFKKFNTTGLYTVNYRMGSDTNAVKSDFFLKNNDAVEQHYNGDLPWRKTQ
jgi:glycosyltransferase involved in cell wall biosynthesis